jgi:hypothetical protein
MALQGLCKNGLFSHSAYLTRSKPPLRFEVDRAAIRQFEMIDETCVIDGVSKLLEKKEPRTEPISFQVLPPCGGDLQQT